MKSNVKSVNLVAGILWSLSILLSFFIGGYRGFGGFLSLAFSVSLAVFLFMDNKKMAVIPMTLMALRSVFKLSLGNFIFLLAQLCLLFFLLSSTYLKDKLDAKLAKKIWFVPGVLTFLSCIIVIVSVIYYIPLFYVIIFLIEAASYFVLGYWAAKSEHSVDVITEENEKITQSTYAIPKETPSVDGYCDLLKHILLLVFTFGIWMFIWIYKTTIFLNNTSNDEKRNPTTELLLCMFIPFYIIFWTYKSAQKIDKFAISKGQQSDISTLCLILSIFIGIVPPIMMQEKINSLVVPQSFTDSVEANPTVPVAKETHVANNGVAEEIMKYKELLDLGAITEEEYNEKKKQLLNI